MSYKKNIIYFGVLRCFYSPHSVSLWKSQTSSWPPGPPKSLCFFTFTFSHSFRRSSFIHRLYYPHTYVFIMY